LRGLSGGGPSAALTISRSGGSPQPLPEGLTSSLGFTEDELIVVRAAAAPSASASASAGGGGGGGGGAAAAPLGRLPIRALARSAAAPRLDPAAYGSLRLEDLTFSLPAEQLRDILLHGGGRLLAQLKRRGGDAELAAAAEGSAGVPGAAPLRDLMQRRAVEQGMPSVQRAIRAAEMERRLAADPTDAEAQRFIEEAIQRRNVEDNRELALDLMPETFARHEMLMVRLHVNGVAQLAMVDTGAQVTIISSATAAQCGIARMVDTKFATTMKGVGSGRSLGRVHMCELRVGDARFAAGFNVMEKEDMEFLLGLDFLQRFRACGAVVRVGGGAAFTHTRARARARAQA